jgi:regulator of RNase E activity RraB
VNEKLSSIFLDLGIRPKAPDPNKPWLAWIWVYMKSPREDGLSESNESDLPGLHAIESALIDTFPEKLQGVVVGRITTDGRKEFYYYVSSADGIEESIHKYMKKFPKYKYDMGVKEDPHWTQYLELLYPSEEEMQKIKNRWVVDALAEKGDQLTTPRNVEHWIYFRTVTERQRLIDAVLPLGFRITAESSDLKAGNEFPHRLQLIRSDSVDQDSIDEVTLELFRFSKLFDANYDGWETFVVKDDAKES